MSAKTFIFAIISTVVIAAQGRADLNLNYKEWTEAIPPNHYDTFTTLIPNKLHSRIDYFSKKSHNNATKSCEIIKKVLILNTVLKL